MSKFMSILLFLSTTSRSFSTKIRETENRRQLQPTNACSAASTTYQNGPLCPNYDEGEWIYHQLKDDATGVGKWKVFKNTSWVNVPLVAPGRSLLTNDARVKLRVSKPYKQYETVDALNILTKNDALVVGETYVVAYENAATTWGGKNITHDGNTYNPGDVFQATTTSFTGSSKARVILSNSLNSFNPIYEFSTDDLVATKGNSEDFGQLSLRSFGPMAVSSATRGVIAGGSDVSPFPNTNVIEFITIATLGNPTDFGDLLVARRDGYSTSDLTRGIFAGGYTPTFQNVIEHVTIATTGNAKDFGDLLSPRRTGGSWGDAHGGLG